MRAPSRLATFCVAAVLAACGGQESAAPDPTPEPDGLSAACQNAVDETLVEVDATLAAAAAEDLNQDEPLPEFGASLEAQCSSDEYVDMWGELIIGTWIDDLEDDPSDLRVIARVTLVQQMCELAGNGSRLRPGAQIACGFAEVAGVEPWYAPLVDD